MRAAGRVKAGQRLGREGLPAPPRSPVSRVQFLFSGPIARNSAVICGFSRLCKSASRHVLAAFQAIVSVRPNAGPIAACRD